MNGHGAKKITRGVRGIGVGDTTIDRDDVHDQSMTGDAAILKIYRRSRTKASDALGIGPSVILFGEVHDCVALPKVLMDRGVKLSWSARHVIEHNGFDGVSRLSREQERRRQYS